MLLCTPFLIFFLFFFARKEWGAKFKKKVWEIVATLATVVVVFVALSFAFPEYLDSMIDRVFISTDSGRSHLRIDYILKFLQFPIFGQGFADAPTGWSLALPPEGIFVILPHSVHFKIFTALGIFGALAFTYFYYYKYKVIVNNKSMYNTFAAFSLIMFIIYSFADPIFYYVHIHAITFYIIEGARREYQQHPNRPLAIQRTKLLVDKSTQNVVITFVNGLMLLISAFVFMALYAQGKYLISESFSYLLTIILLVFAGAVFVPASEKLGRIIYGRIFSKKRK